MARLIAHEWIEKFGGAEKVVDAFVDTFPDADLATLWSDDPSRYPSSRLLESPLAGSSLRRRKSLALPFMSHTWRTMDVSGYDSVLISSHAFAHHLGTGRGQRHLRRHVYVHTPARYLWAPEVDPRGRGLGPTVLGRPLRHLDRKYVGEARYAANSHFVRERIRRAWGVHTEVIYPPVDVMEYQATADWASTLSPEEREGLDRLPAEFVLGASRMVPYKGLDAVIDFGHATGVPVVLAGAGPHEQDLRRHAERAGSEVHFVLQPSNELLRALYQKAVAYIYPPIEDFGIMPIEAMSLGTPVIVNKIGGAAESSALVGGGVALDFNAGGAVQRHALRSAMNLDMVSASRNTRTFDAEEFKRRIWAWAR